ncbi:uncharacterized protein PHACADRAFT_32451 [Phanerochaete carnosa HHB-10118-sp]|uniref:Uncharacterized protein n=1 Tax=Phanerochaete carnosa (strain HHB-10118-sp) TaxID=650164 RepID=K5VGS2_PHACS|nr:uncharacterized protein PHACADRAFT_32451 [Phanerochaete carnosa HHB-10118-sp]EKM50398.1 hypothetical protein PHACADRAFT_32451 [Phanerochaete carnosa HHB-10118-sp]
MKQQLRQMFKQQLHDVEDDKEAARNGINWPKKSGIKHWWLVAASESQDSEESQEWNGCASPAVFSAQVTADITEKRPLTVEQRADQMDNAPDWPDPFEGVLFEVPNDLQVEQAETESKDNGESTLDEVPEAIGKPKTRPGIILEEGRDKPRSL